MVREAGTLAQVPPFWFYLTPEGETKRHDPATVLSQLYGRSTPVAHGLCSSSPEELRYLVRRGA